MEQQTLIPPPRPQIKDEAAQRAKTRYFPSLIWGGGGGGGLGFPFILFKIVVEPFSGHGLAIKNQNCPKRRL